MNKRFNDVGDSSAKGVSNASIPQNHGDIHENNRNDGPEDQRVSNILPFLYIGLCGNRQVCNVAVLATSCVPAKCAVFAATAQWFWNSEALVSHECRQGRIIHAVEAVLAAS